MSRLSVSLPSRREENGKRNRLEWAVVLLRPEFSAYVGPCVCAFCTLYHRARV